MVTFQLITHYHNRRGQYTHGTYHAARCNDIQTARAMAKARWNQQARKGATGRVTFQGDNGRAYDPQTFSQN